MMTATESEMLTHFGPETPMGDLLRRYWHPIAGSVEVSNRKPKPVRLMGEDLVLFRDKRGRLGLVADRCPHRSAQMRYGVPEEDGLRCPYHGRVFSASGECLHTPSDRGSTVGKWRTGIKAYPVEELGGLVFAYLGPQPAPILPKWEYLVQRNFVKQIGYMRVKCNWLQVAENAVDLEHLYWLHSYYAQWQLDNEGVAKDDPRRAQPNMFAAYKDCEYKFKPFERGIMRWYEKPSEQGDGQAHMLPVIFPHLAVVQGNGEWTMNFRVPIDDTETLYISYMCFNPTGDPVPPQAEIPCYEVPVMGPDGVCLTDFQNGQDAMVWITQGVTANRQLETLGREDHGVVLLRRMLKEQLARVAAGDDPMNVFRAPVDESCFLFNLPAQARSSQSYLPGMACGPYLPSHSPIQELVDTLFLNPSSRP
ncbi:Rieske 2Fe-2S domain-containing protein [Caenimonas soli]|uniref:Rieske 2Fe-2S domain-containing protein n=1 Tax=Caenimonas soli TaxID=2735555 RepID=UPI0015516D48|nr:Rieske 2Fe-2S domain-containing protein [Caenimonas soli]NPC58556.1 Rieske 2Fe-2S domain-containing protein [Caenimonas soli]